MIFENTRLITPAYIPVKGNVFVHDTGICPVHIIAKFIKKREYECSPAKNKPLLLRLDDGPLPPTHVNHLIKNLILKMKLNPNNYPSHSLRAGRATDLARSLKPTWCIKKWGRWRSNCWEDFYVKLDLTDMAIIANKSLHEMGLFNNSQTQS